jgi:hypothetical protein
MAHSDDLMLPRSLYFSILVLVAASCQDGGNSTVGIRTNFATRPRRDYGIETARVILGHRSAAVTHIYAEADMQKLSQVVTEVG